MGFFRFLNTRLFAHAEESEQDFEKIKKVDDKLTFSVSHLFGFDYLRSQWNKLITDSEGRLIVSSGATTTRNCEISEPNVDGSPSLVANYRENRKELWIHNSSGFDLYLLFDDSAGLTSGMLIPKDATFIFTVYIGEMYMINNSGSGSIYVVDVY